MNKRSKYSKSGQASAAKRTLALLAAFTTAFTIAFAAPGVAAASQTGDESESAASLANSESLLDKYDDVLTDEAAREQAEHIPAEIDGINSIDTSIDTEEENANQSDGSIPKVGANLESKYDMRDQSWAKNIIVKDQGETQLCWAMTLTSAAEISYAMNNGTAPEYSPVQLAYFTYNRVNDPLGNTAGDKNVLKSGNYATSGGNSIVAGASLATWQGYAFESKAPFSSYINPNTGKGSKLSSDLAYDNDALIKDMTILNSKEAVKEEVKEAVKEKGSVIVSMYFDGSEYGNRLKYYNSDNYAYYGSSNSSTSPNHAVLIVGWDDNYSRNNFNSNKRPAENGAWIVQNSWGSEFGDNGYFYISYEEALSDLLSIEAEDADLYDYNYQYDGNSNLKARAIKKIINWPMYMM